MRVGFIGCGRHAMRAIYPAIAPAGLELVATCARHLAAAQAAAQVYGAPAAYDDVRTMLKREELGGVLISLPLDQYEGVIGACIDAGTPAWAEKPAGDSAAALRRLVFSARVADVPVMVGYMKRFAPAYRRARDYLIDPSFGKVTSMHMRFVVGPWGSDVRHYLIDGAVHALDLVRYFGGEAKDVQACKHAAGTGQTAISALIELTSGAIATAQLGTVGSFAQESEQLDIVGVGHAVTVRNVDTVERRPLEGPVEVLRPNYTIPLEANFSSTIMGFLPELRHWRAVVEEGTECESDLTSALRTLELAEHVFNQIS